MGHQHKLEAFGQIKRALFPGMGRGTWREDRQRTPFMFEKCRDTLYNYLNILNCFLLLFFLTCNASTDEDFYSNGYGTKGKKQNHALFQDKLLRKIKALQGESFILDINKAETMSDGHNCGSVLKGSNTPK